MRSNAWYRVKYTLQAPFYDRVVTFRRQRARSVALVNLQPGERVLIVGAGTGADLAVIPSYVEVLATDLSRAMLAQARRHARPGVSFEIMDAHALALPDASVDAVLLHMVLQVVPEPARCLREAARVLRPGGRIGIFDKFLADEDRPGLIRRAALAALDVVFNSTRRSFEDIQRRAEAGLELAHDEPDARRPFRHVLLRKPRAANPA